MTMNKISCFSQIQVEPNTLFVLDIDDTLIRFKELGKTWWKHIYSAYLIEYKGDHSQAKWATLKIWMDKIYMYKPYPIAPFSFTDLLSKIESEGGELILLTARDESLRQITEQNLKDCNIIIPSDKIYFNEEKGKELKRILQNEKNGYKKVVFVDDVEKNLLDVSNELEEICQVKVYLFED